MAFRQLAPRDRQSAGVGANASGDALRAFDAGRHAASDFLAAWLDCASRLDDEARHQFERYYAGYLKRFDSYMRHSYDRRLEPLLTRVRAGMRVLEVGSGCGSECLFLASLGCEVTGIEIHKKRLHTARERQSLLEELRGAPLPCRFVKGSLFDEDLNLGGAPFDIVWMEEAFHHLEPRGRVGESIATLLPAGGRLVIAETNALNPLIQLQLLRARGWPKIRTFTDDRGRTHEYGVERVTSAVRLARLFGNAGFQTELVRHERLFPNLGVAPQALMALERFLNFVPRCAFVHYTWVGRRNP